MNKPASEILRDPADLRPHAILIHLPAPAKDSAEVCACADAIREQDGHLLPLVIDETGHLLTDDSRLRWLAARRMALKEVPVTIQPGALAPVIALNALIHRQHLTKGAIAYLAIPLLKPAFEAAREVRLKNLRNSKDSSIGHSVTYAQTWEQMAENVGVSKGLFVAAIQVRGEFEKDKRKYPFTIEGGDQDGETVEQTLREHFEPKLLRQQVDSEHEQHRPIGLGAVMKAIGSIRSTKGGTKVNDSQLELFKGSFLAGAKRLRYWNDMGPTERSEALVSVMQWVDAMPADLREEVLDAIKAARKGAK